MSANRSTLSPTATVESVGHSSTPCYDDGAPPPASSFRWPQLWWHAGTYFELLNSYRRGDIEPLLTTFAESARTAAAQSRVTATRLDDIADEWRERVEPVRNGSAVVKLLTLLPSRQSCHQKMPAPWWTLPAAACSRQSTDSSTQALFAL
jgi:hypothetical protein